MPPDIAIHPVSKRNSLTFLIAACIGCIVCFFLIKLQWFLPAYIVITLTILLFILALAKYLEPKVSISLSPDYFTWHLRHGDVPIEWSNLTWCCLLSVETSRGTKPLHFVGIKVSSLIPVIQNLSLRNAKNLYQEYHCLTLLSSNNETVFEHQKINHKETEHHEFSGIKAQLFTRLVHLKSTWNAELYIPTQTLDRPEEDFVRLVNEYRLASLHQTLQNNEKK